MHLRLALRLENRLTGARISLATNLNYGEFSPYGRIDSTEYIIDYLPTNGSPRLGRSIADFSRPEGPVGLLVSSGFVDPSVNQSGPAFSTFVAFPNGKSFELTQNITPIEDEEIDLPDVFDVVGTYPNPFASKTRLVFDLPTAAEVEVQVFDVTGREVVSVPSQMFAAGRNLSIEMSANGLASGLYLYRVQAVTQTRTWVDTGRMMLVRASE